MGGARAVFVARVGSDEQMRIEELRGGVLVIIFELLLVHLEDEKERSQLLGLLLAWWRVREKTSLKEESQLENRGWELLEYIIQNMSQVLAYSSDIVLFYE